MEVWVEVWETAQGCQSGGVTSEMQIFGAGFPVQVDLRSVPIDLQEQKNINPLRWRALQDSAWAEFVRQQVEPGDAVDSLASNTNIVNLPLGQALIGNVWIEPRVLTPNGDGVNERLVVSLDLVNILQD